MISYAQILEDVILARALKHVAEGFYIDVGGYHPDRGSITKHFYENGWRGINIEPGRSYFPPFVTMRPRDINLQVAVSDCDGEAVFYEMDQISSLESRVADQHQDQITGQYTVPVITLAQICDEYAPHEIHFLKIDVEGHEGAVLRGMNFQRYRPWVLVIEAKEPNRLDISTHEQWEQMVLDSGYTFAFADILNRYYVANEHRDLVQYFGPADDYIRATDIWRVMELEQQLAEANRRLEELKVESLA